MKFLNEKGQSAIEFIIAFAFILAISFLFVRLAFNFTTGYLAHYATFMASRVFLTQDSSAGPAAVASVVGSASGGGATTASGLAKNEFLKYRLDVVGVDQSKLRFNIPGSGVLNDFVGAYFEFELPMSILGFVGGNKKAKLVSESFLGKEPPRGTCFQRTCWAMNHSDQACENPAFFLTLFDNGC